MRAPIDPTTTTAWATLTSLRGSGDVNLREAFATDPQRAQRFTKTAGDLRVDLSKNLITDDVVAALVQLAEQVDLPERIEAMFTGERINVTEDRAVLHTALRAPKGSALVVDGQDVNADVHEVLEQVYDFARKVRSGDWKGVTGKPIAIIRGCNVSRP